MSAISEKTIGSVLFDINNMISDYKNTLSSLSDTENELIFKASVLENYNGAKVAGSKRKEDLAECTKYYYDKFFIIGASATVSNSNSILKEIDRLETNVQEFKKEIKEMDDSLAVITIYLVNVRDALSQGIISADKSYDEMSIKDKFDCVSQLMIKDKELDYKYLNTTPIIRDKKMLLPLYNGGDYPEIKCKYLEFYNNNGQKVLAPLIKIKRDSDGKYTLTDMSSEEIEAFTNQTSTFHNEIMNEDNKYSDKFKENAIKPLKQITLEYIDYDTGTIDNSDWCAYTYGNSYAVFDMKYTGETEDTHQFMVETYSHELGHSFDYTNNYLSETINFTDIYNQINARDIKCETIREYGHTTSCECFAECTLLYYNDPESLKTIDLEGVGFDNLYEYMKSVLE